jgi:hypothetical protein
MPRQNTTPQATKVPTSFHYTGPMIPQTPASPAASSFGQIVKDGFGFGVGTSIARHLVDKLIGGGPTSTQPSPQTVVKKEHDITSSFLTDSQRILYNQCIIEGGTHELCKENLQ